MRYAATSHNHIDYTLHEGPLSLLHPTVRSYQRKPLSSTKALPSLKNTVKVTQWLVARQMNTQAFFPFTELHSEL
jgi:hypothetical protein